MWPVFADMLYEGEDVPKAAPPVESKPVESQPVDTVKHVEKNEPVERNPPGVPADPPATIVDWPTETLQTREEPAVKHAPIEAPESTAKSWWSSVMVDLDENEPAPQQPFAQKQEQIKPAEPEPAPETKHPEQQPSPPATPAEPIRSSSQASKSGTETKNRALSFLRSVLAGYDDDDEGGTANAQPVRNNPTKQSRRDQNRKNSMASAASSWSGEWWKSLVAQEDDTPVADYTANVFVTGESDVIKTHKRAAKAESVPDASKIPEKGKDHGSKSDVLNWLKSHLTEPDGEDATDKRKRGAASAPASWRGDWLGSLIAQEEDVPVADYSANVFVTGESEVIKTPQRAPKSEDSSKSHGSTVKHKPDVVSWLKSQVADKILTNDEDIETPKQAKKESRRQANWEDSIPASWGGDWLGSLVAQEGDVPVADYTANVFVTGEADGVKTPKRASESNSHEKGSAHHSSKPDVLNWLKSHLTDTLADDEGHETVSKRPAQRGPNTASGKLRNEPSFTDSTSETLRSCAQGYYGLDQTFDRHCAERCPEGKCSASVCGCGPGIRNNR
ncbi:hypothetical protein BJ742DRAFT_72508 [Cladochytrium replicatum]|nr:hypothetical protein BJ742DRAFT_72508 [Cladochytrium replicatum]